MKQDCDHHERTATASRAGQEDDSHAAACPACGDTALVTRTLARLAQEADTLPEPAFDAASLFRRAAFVARLFGDETRARRAGRPLAVAQAVGWGVLLAATTAWLARAAAARTLGHWPDASGLAQLVQGIALWPLAIGMVVALAAARVLWVED